MNAISDVKTVKHGVVIGDAQLHGESFGHYDVKLSSIPRVIVIADSTGRPTWWCHEDSGWRAANGMWTRFISACGTKLIDVEVTR
jgi:hypothetical protein